MKILPDYLIEYMPYIEEALEELRLSILDHAYELLKSLDIDELTTDDIRHKLELYDIKVENMTDAWLPNGRFYRMYPSIKHNRTRLNDLMSIAKSGGQFEGVWSSEFNTKDKYNFKTISVARHYDIGSDMDGYFYISGDTSRNKDGSIKSSAIAALQTDILIASALPAGYTYLYIPWPRPHYPDDSTYFYNVHMLDYDRLSYAEDCLDIFKRSYNQKAGWVLSTTITVSGVKYPIYKNANNSLSNRFYNTYYKLYGQSTNGSHQFLKVYNDKPFLEDNLPASTYYNWDIGDGTSFRTPYWFDYHYMNNLNHTEDSNHISLTWPITETGTYYGINEDGDYYVIPRDKYSFENLYNNAVKYVPDQKELYSQYEYDDHGKRKSFEWSTFPTACYSHARYRTSEPNRLQSFYTYDNKYSAVLTHCSDDSPETIKAIVANLANVTVDEAYRIINNLPYVIDYNVSKDSANVIKEVFEHLITKIIVTSLIDPSMLSDFKSELMYIYDLDDSSVDQLVANFPDEPLVLLSPTNKGLIEVYPELQPYCNMTMITVDCGIEIHDYKTIDENCTTDITNKCKQEPSAYRHDLLLKDAFILDENLHHVKTFRPVWSEESPIFDLLQTTYKSNIGSNQTIITITSAGRAINAMISILCTHCGVDYYEAGAILSRLPYDVSSDDIVTSVSEFISALYSYRNYGVTYNISGLPVGNNSLYYWSCLKQSENRSQLSLFNGDTIKEYESIVSSNTPAISEETFTSYDRPTIGKLDAIYVSYTKGVNYNQGTDNSLSSCLRSAFLLCDYGSSTSNSYDSTMSYRLLFKYKQDSTDPYYDGDEDISEIEYEPYAYIEGDPSNNKLYVNLNEVVTSGINTSYNYITYKKLKTHRLWFSSNKSNVLLHEYHNYLYTARRPEISDDGYKIFRSGINVYDHPSISANSTTTMSSGTSIQIKDTSAGWIRVNQDGQSEQWIHSKYTNVGVDELYVYSSNTKLLTYDIIGLYDSDGNKVECDAANLSLFINRESGATSYELVCDAYNYNTVNYIGVDLNNQWKHTDSRYNLDDATVVSLLDTPNDYTVFKSFSNTGVENDDATMYLKIYSPIATSIDFKILGCCEYFYDFPRIEVYDDSNNCISSTEWRYENSTLEDAEWKDGSISLPSPGRYTVNIIYRKDFSVDEGIDCAYFAIETSKLNKLIVEYSRVSAAYVDFTVNQSDGSVKDDTADIMPSEYGDGMWTPSGNQLYPKYISSRDLFYGDEDNWWLPRDEYINRGYVFKQSNITLQTNNIEAGHKLTESALIKLGTFDIDYTDQ